MRHLVVEAEGELAEAARSPVPVRPPPLCGPSGEGGCPRGISVQRLAPNPSLCPRLVAVGLRGGGNVKDDLNPLIFKELLVAPHSQATF